MKTQEETAAWMGTTVEQMNKDHDALHIKLCAWLGVESQSMRIARGETVTHAEWIIANYEEDAVLNLQRFIYSMKDKL